MRFTAPICRAIFIAALCLKPNLALAYNIDLKQMSVSGLSSGAYMAGQIHVANSSRFFAAALLAGGPYYCAEGDINLALEECSQTSRKEFDVHRLTQEAQSLSQAKQIDPIANLKNARLYLFSGKLDQTVMPHLSQASHDFYLKLGARSENIKYNDSLETGHAFPSLNYGNPCSTVSESPYINNCRQDVAGDFLKHIYPDLKERTEFNKESFYLISQDFNHSPRSLSLADHAIAYIPDECQTKKCRLHIAFHGCRQTTEHIGDQFYMRTGYNEWAENNRLIILYPQAVSSYYPYNPRGCWDWWGYTGPNYHTKSGPQHLVIRNLIDTISDINFRAKKVRNL